LLQDERYRIMWPSSFLTVLIKISHI
jgi:hypothetical protein